MIVQSFGSLQAMTAPASRAPSSSSGSLNLYGSTQTYSAIYRTQPNVRTVIDFLARNVAQLGCHAFRRVSDTDRERLPDHELAGWLKHPNPATSRYRLIEALMQDLGVYFRGYWLKVRSAPMGLVRLPPDQMSVTGRLIPTSFVWTVNGRDREFAPSEVVYFCGSTGFDPDQPLAPLSPLETLRRVLAEEAAAAEHREGFWRNSARIEGVVTRPKEQKRYSDTQAQSWREQWQSVYAGGAGAGKTVLLQEGETFTPTAWSSKDSEYVAARKLTREECAAAYHVPLPMVGILEHATFSNIKEQHKHLYQDCLGPWLVMIEEEIERQLLIECEDQANVYVEFNIAEKLKGSFEEQATSLQVLVGRPIMTANEGRARLNLPSIDDPAADELAAQQGGPAAAAPPVDPAADAVPPPPKKPRAAADALEFAPVIQATRDRQHARLAKLPVVDRPAAFAADLDRWNRELATDLGTVTGADETVLAAATNAETLRRLEADALEARVTAIERQPPPRIDVHPPSMTINIPAAKVHAKEITMKRDDTGAVVGAVVCET